MVEVVRVRLVDDKSKGCEDSPVEILKLLRHVRNKENGVEINFDELKLEEIHVDLGNKEEANHLIFENSKEILSRNFRSFFIGGGDCITYSILKAFDKIEKNKLVIIFDSHGESVQDGGWLKNLIDEGFNGRNIILVGVRNINKNEREYLKEEGITLINMDVIQEDIFEICDLIMERARKSDSFYISINMDCLDPGFAPGVNNIEPGGLSSRELIYFVKRLRLLNNFKGGGIVNINLEKDIHGMTAKLGAKLLGEMI